MKIKQIVGEKKMICTSKASISSKEGFLIGASSSISMSIVEWLSGRSNVEPNDSIPRIMRTALTIWAMVFDWNIEAQLFGIIANVFTSKDIVAEKEVTESP